jgi:hypothetical protein
MAGSEDKFLVRAPSDVTFDGEVWGIEVNQSDGGKQTYMIAGADGKAEAARVANENARKESELERGTNEAIRQSNEAERAAKDAERDAATKAANTAALSASSAAQSANANAANANAQANAAKAAAAQANAAARLTKPYFIQQSEPPYADRVDGGMWVETAGTAVRSINRWDSAKQGAALYPSATTYPQSTTFPAPTGEWSKFTV